jgi:hypothetical protein
MWGTTRDCHGRLINPGFWRDAFEVVAMALILPLLLIGLLVRPPSRRYGGDNPLP